MMPSFHACRTAICCRNITAGGDVMVKPESKEKAMQVTIEKFHTPAF